MWGSFQYKDSKTFVDSMDDNVNILEKNININIQNVFTYFETSKQVQDLISQINDITFISNPNSKSIEQVSYAADNLTKMTSKLNQQLSFLKLFNLSFKETALS